MYGILYVIVTFDTKHDKRKKLDCQTDKKTVQFPPLWSASMPARVNATYGKDTFFGKGTDMAVQELQLRTTRRDTPRENYDA